MDESHIILICMTRHFFMATMGMSDCGEPPYHKRIIKLRHEVLVWDELETFSWSVS